MIKRLLRKWLRRQIIKAYTMPKQIAFEWIYYSPISTWRDKLFCLRNSMGGVEKDYDWLIDTSNSSNGS